jgi:tetratricopeptide (TPR) repeat protein
MPEAKLRPAVKQAKEIMRQDPRKALTMIDKALAEDPDDPQAHFVKGQILAFHLGRPRDAREHLARTYKAVIENFYMAPGAHRAFAKCLAMLDERDNARRVLDICLQIYPDDLDAWLDRGDLSKLEGKYEDAIRDTQEVLARVARHPLGVYNLACYLALAGHTERALDALAFALEVEPSDRDNARHDDDFASLRTHPRFVTLTGKT